MVKPSKQFQQIAAAIPSDFNIGGDDVATVRAKMKPFHGHPVSAETKVHYTEVSGAEKSSLAWVTAEKCCSTTRNALFCHGGGFVSCTAEEYLFFAEYISEQLNAIVAVPNYRLAPEAQYPAALDDCLATYEEMLSLGISPSDIFFIGDSCGGGLAASTLLRARDAGLPMPACFVGLTAWLDLQLNDAPRNAPRTEPMITPDWYRNRVRDYLGDVEPTIAYASPAFADCTGLPPLLMQVGSNDLSLSGARQFAENAQRDGVTAKLDVYEGMVHGFHGLIGSGVPEAQLAWQAARQFVDEWMVDIRL